MSDIDTRLDEILVKVASISIAADGNEYRACLLDAKQAIKQLMADEFEKLIGEDTYDERDDHDTLRRQLRQKLEEWKQ